MQDAIATVNVRAIAWDITIQSAGAGSLRDVRVSTGAGANAVGVFTVSAVSFNEVILNAVGFNEVIVSAVGLSTGDVRADMLSALST